MSTTARIAVKTAKQTILFNKRHDGYPSHIEVVLLTFLQDIAMNGMPTTAEEIETRLNKADYPDEKGYRPDIDLYAVTDRKPITILRMDDDAGMEYYYTVDLTDADTINPETGNPWKEDYEEKVDELEEAEEAKINPETGNTWEDDYETEKEKREEAEAERDQARAELATARQAHAAATKAGADLLRHAQDQRDEARRDHERTLDRLTRAEIRAAELEKEVWEAKERLGQAEKTHATTKSLLAESHYAHHNTDETRRKEEEARKEAETRAEIAEAEWGKAIKERDAEKKARQDLMAKAMKAIADQEKTIRERDQARTELKATIDAHQEKPITLNGRETQILDALVEAGAIKQARKLFYERDVIQAKLRTHTELDGSEREALLGLIRDANENEIPWTNDEIPF